MNDKTVLFCGPIDSPVNSGRYMISGIRQNGYKVIGYDYRTHSDYQNDLVEIVRKEKPHYIIVLKGEKISHDLTEKFKKAGCITILWLTMIAPEEHIATLISGYDFIISNVSYYVDYFKTRGVERIKWIHQGFAPEFFGIESPDSPPDHYYTDVAMIGSMGDRIYRTRCELIIELQKKNINIKWWGPRLARQWRNLQFYLAGVQHAWMGREVYMEDFADVVRHIKIFLGQDADIVNTPGKYLSNRVFAVLGCGGFYIGRRTPGLCSVFEVGKELEAFDTFDELLEKIRYYLENEDKRRQIALAGQNKVLHNYTYKQQIHKIFEWVNQQL